MSKLQQKIALNIGFKTIFYTFMTMTFLCILSTSPRSEGIFMDGNRLLEYCESDNISRQNKCLGYIMAIADSVAVFNSTEVFKSYSACVPKGVSDTQLRDIVVRYFRRYPQVRHQDASSQVFLALGETWKRCY